MRIFRKQNASSTRTEENDTASWETIKKSNTKTKDIKTNRINKTVCIYRPNSNLLPYTITGTIIRL